MRKNFGSKPWCYPQPVFIVGTYNSDGTPNVMNAAWGGINDDNELFICMGTNHKTTQNLDERKAFTVSMADAAHVIACDYVGLASGLKEQDKFAKAGFTAIKSEFVDAPIIAELAMAIECKVKSYDKETCRLIGEIVNISIDESVLTADNKVDVKKLAPIVFDPINHAYLKLGDKVGNAFRDGMQLS